MYIFNNLDRTLKPLIIQVIGLAMAGSGVILLGAAGGHGNDWDVPAPRRPAQASKFYQGVDLAAVVNKAAAGDNQLTFGQPSVTRTDSLQLTVSFTGNAASAQRFMQRLKTELRQAVRASGADTADVVEPGSEGFVIGYSQGAVSGEIVAHLQGGPAAYQLAISVEEFEE
jgi:hypothetical protein